MSKKNISKNTSETGSKTEKKFAKKIPAGRLARAGVAGATGAKVGVKSLKFLATSPFKKGEAAKSHRNAHEQDIARTIFEGLSHLRGTALKIAQIFSLETGLLPVAFNNELYKAHYQVPPLNRAVARKVIISELGEAPEKLFKSLDLVAFAGASLGQVHEAFTFEGRRLAIKIQYPGIDRAIASDFAMVRTFLLPFLKSQFAEKILSEIYERLQEEIDYRKEMENTNWFRENLPGPVTVPETFPNFTTQHILTTEMLDGIHLDQWLATKPSQADINHRAQLIFDAFIQCFFVLGRIQADPNPGNYLFLREGGVGLIDFGCIKRFETDFTARLGRLFSSYGSVSGEKMVELHEEFGFSAETFGKSKIEIYEELIQPFFDLITLPFRTEVFDFKSHPELREIDAKAVVKFIQGFHFNGFSHETIFLYRSLLGLFRIFAMMGARLKMKNEWLS